MKPTKSTGFTSQSAETWRPATAAWSMFARIKNLGRRNVILIAVALVAVGLAFNSGALAAAGLPPLLIAFLPCVAMCALGICKKGDGNGPGCSKSSGAGEGSSTLGRD
jgi:hypothetical protein